MLSPGVPSTGGPSSGRLRGPVVSGNIYPVAMLLHRARLLDLHTGVPGFPCDIMIRGDRVESVHPVGGETVGGPDVEVIDLAGRLVIPGLWDQHVHAGQWALASRRLKVSQTARPEEILAEIAAQLDAIADSDGDGIIQGFGLRASRWPANPSAADLDAVTGARPVAIVSADLHSTWCNTAALERLGMSDRPGFLTEADSFTAQIRLAQVSPRTLDRWLDECCRAAAARGVVGIRDMEFSSSTDLWLARQAAGRCPMWVQVAVYPARLQEASGRHLATGQSAAAGSMVEMGPLKIIVDGSISSRSAWCRKPYQGAVGPQRNGVDSIPPEELESLMTRARAAGLRPAVHAIGNLAVHTVLDAFARTGAAGTLEHAQLVDDADLPRFAELGVAASIQPAHLVDDRDTTDVVWADQPHLSFRYRDLLDAGARLLMGSDAPVSPVDPWLAIRVAVERTADRRPGWHLDQAITLSEALLASTGGVSAVRPGGRADLVALDVDPFTTHGEELGSTLATLTIAGGLISHSML